MFVTYAIDIKLRSVTEERRGLHDHRERNNNSDTDTTARCRFLGTRQSSNSRCEDGSEALWRSVGQERSDCALSRSHLLTMEIGLAGD